MAVIWETIKAQVISRRDEWKRQEALGVQVPHVPHWMIPRDSVSFEEAAIALHEIQSAQLALPGTETPKLGFDDSTIKESDSEDEIKAAALATIREKLARFNSPNKKRRF
jgi:hypothetical protein